VLDATDTDNITLAAHYEYGPYVGVVCTASLDDNPCRFSTK